MSEWKPISEAPYRRQIVVGRSGWKEPTTVYWASSNHKSRDLENWIDPPTHFLKGLDMPEEVK